MRCRRVVTSSCRGSSAVASVVVEEIENAATGNVLRDHVVVAVLVEGQAHVVSDVGMAHLIDYFDFFYKVRDAFFLDAFSPKSLHCDDVAHPERLEDLAVAATAQEVVLVVEFEVHDVDVEGEAVFVEGVEQIVVGIDVEVPEFIIVIFIDSAVPINLLLSTLKHCF